MAGHSSCQCTETDVFESGLQEAKSRAGGQKPLLLLAALRDRDPNRDTAYAEIKHFGSIVAGVQTQCFIEFKAFKPGGEDQVCVI